MSDSQAIHESLSIIVHGPSKAGKSTFANTSPAPRLLVDAEMAYRFLPGKKVFWDPHTEAPPIYDGSWETCVVITREYSDMQKTYEWLNSGQHPFTSVVIDSVSEIQSRAKDTLASSGRLDQQTWGDLLYEMDKLIRGFRDLTEHKIKPVRAVVLTAMTQLKDGKYRPYVQGQLQVKLPYFMDVIGFLYPTTIQDPNDPTKAPVEVRQMLTRNHDLFEAGERVQGRLPNPVVNPTVPDMLAMVFPPEATEQTEETVTTAPANKE